MKQPPYSPIPVEKQVAILFAGANGYLDSIAVENIGRFESGLYNYLDNTNADLLRAIREKKELNDDIKAQLNAALKEFKQRFQAEARPEETQASSQQGASSSRPGMGASTNGSRPPANAGERTHQQPERTPAQV